MEQPDKVPKPISPLVDEIDLREIFEKTIARQWFTIWILLAIVMVGALAVFTLVVRNHVFILPQGTEKRAPAAETPTGKSKFLFREPARGFLAEEDFGRVALADGNQNHRARSGAIARGATALD